MIPLLGRWTKRALLLTATVFLLVSFTPFDQWYARQLAGAWEDPKGDTLIVLGGSMLEDGLLGTSSYWRAVYAVRAWRQGGFRQVILSGDANPNHTPVSVAMKEFLVAGGVPAEVIRLESASRSTRENVLFVKRMLEGDTSSKVLLTSDYHMFRAYRAFRKEGIAVQPRPFPDASKQANCLSCRWQVFIMLLTETAKILYYFGQGWL